MAGRVVTSLLNLIVAGVVVAAEPPSATSSAASAGPLDEVVVVGARRERLARMRQAITAAEDRFFQRYNVLNDKSEFDIECRQVKRTGSIRDVRSCAPRIVDSATEAEGLAVWDAMDRADPLDPKSGEKSARPRGGPASALLAAKAPEYKANMLRLLRRHPELRALVRERDELQRAYDKARKAK